MELEKEKPGVREKALSHGMDFPDDIELVMLILGAGTKKMPISTMAKKIVETLDSSNSDQLVQNLVSLPGVGEGKALAIAAALELGRRRNCFRGAHINTPQSIIPFVRNYAICSKEHFLVITLNGGHDIIQIHIVSVGTVNRTIIHPREIFTEAIKENAAAIILCHNHPSGRTMPSDEDIMTTENLIQASKIMGIPILDHLIIDCSTYFSFMEHGLLFTAED